MIFRRDGSEVNVAYNVSGDELNAAYNLAGELVLQNIEFTDTPLSYSAYGNQGFDVYNNILAQYGSSYYIAIRQLSDGTTLRNIDSGLTVHGNDVSFMPFKYAETDAYPLLYLDGPVVRLSGSTATNLYSIHTPHGDGNSWTIYGSAFDGNLLYTVGYTTTYTDKNSLVFIETWDISDDVEYPTLISQVTRKWLVCIQGAAYHDGLLWCACGIGDQSTGAHIYALNPENGNIVYHLTLNHYNELEGIAWVNDEENGDYIIYGTYGNKYHKITFQ